MKKKNTTLYTPRELMDAEDQLTAEMKSSNGGDQFLRFNKGGEWCVLSGGESNTLPPDTFLFGLVTSFVKGHIAFAGDGSKVGESCVPIVKALPDPLGLRREVSPQGWQVQYGLTFIESETNDPIIFRTTTHGGKKAVMALLGEVVKRLKANTPAWPLVALARDSYTHRRHGLIWTPEFRIVKWYGESEIPAG